MNELESAVDFESRIEYMQDHLDDEKDFYDDLT